MHLSNGGGFVPPEDFEEFEFPGGKPEVFGAFFHGDSL